MFLEIISELYDAAGRRSYKPHLKKGLSPPTFPFGRYVSRPLQVRCSTLQEIRDFLRHCKQASDKETFGEDDYWVPPEQFEKIKQGDCDDFALWTWRQLLQMGYKARFVAGRYGRYRQGHAWTTFKFGGKDFIADGTHCYLGMRLPRLQIMKYHPIYSVEWDGERIQFYSHAKDQSQIGLGQLFACLPEWFFIWTAFWMKNFHKLPVAGFRYVRRRLRLTVSKNHK
jgi:hypothetical protein